MKLSERIKQLSKKQKVTIATVAVLVVLGGSFGYKAYADGQTKKQVEQAQVLVDKQSKEIKDLQVDIKALFNAEKPDFLNKDVSEETLSPIREKLDKIEKNYDSIVLPTKEVKTKDYSNYLASCKESLETVQSMLTTQKEVNGLFGKTVIVGDVVTKDVAIKDDLKADTVKTTKDSYYNKESKSEWQKAINSLLDNVDNQLNQINKAKLELEKVYKADKVVTTDTKLYDTAKAEIDKIKNDKIKKDLSAKIDKVKAEIDKQSKEEAEKQAQATVTQQNANTDTAIASANATASGNNQYVADNNNTYAGTEGQATGGYTGDNYTGNNGATGNTPTYTPNQPSTPTGGGSTNTPSTNTGGGTSTGGTNNANTGGQTNYPDYDMGQQSGNVLGGGTWTGGWEEVN